MKKMKTTGLLFAWLMLASASLGQGGEIHTAIFFGDAEKVEALLKAHSNLVTAKNERGETPLQAATARLRDLSVLAAEGPYDGKTRIALATVPGLKKIMEILQKHGAKLDKEIHYCAQEGYEREIQRILQKHPELLNAKDEWELTPLHRAAMHGQKNVVKVLLASKADVNIRGRYGQTPLHRAAMSGHKEIVEMLLAYNADVHAEDQFGHTAWQLATAHGHKDISDRLRQHETKK